ncbi:polysaccharide (de)acetylase [Cyclobacterium sp. SYSU L10401]|uniref:polysaccharide (de)acetylase n=1 Tax=Cyclobacterium sp. SYSU L10401 TaxID=2678657 RepID=UPI0013D7DF9A|nr:polysaccharide (de)acetylase [Cyclobacterium sp. SYSU L10401]
MMNRLIKCVSNIPGWQTNRKIIVLESDDWGSIRMPSIKSYKVLENAGLFLGKGVGGRYNKYDTLASAEDLSMLFEVLTSVKDKNNSSAKITAVSLVANPDFQKIKSSEFQEYYYEPFNTTLERYNKGGAFQLWQEGFNSGIFLPEFHGREHLNVSAWLRALQQEDKEVLLAFNQGVWGFNRKQGIGLQAAFDLEYANDLITHKKIVIDGLDLFEKIHGRRARFFVPPNGPINNALEPVAASKGILFMSTPKIQKEVLGEGKIRRNLRYLGKNNKYNQIYITRNAFFEPSDSNKNEIDTCLSEIELAFKWRKPVIISCHRVNFIGGLNAANRDNSLKQLKQLLDTILKQWPEVEFMTSTELGYIIREKQLCRK